MNIYDDYLFPGASILKPITISAVNQYSKNKGLSIKRETFTFWYA
ncbi:hypothetical protein [Vibrio alfacsensis]